MHFSRFVFFPIPAAAASSSLRTRNAAQLCGSAVHLPLAATHRKTIASMKHPLLDERVEEIRRRWVRQEPDGHFY
jgi:hypothetical protein